MPRALVVGSPIEHSLSPVLHNAAYEALGLVQWSYSKADAEEAQLPSFLQSLGEEVWGVSVTMPNKEAALKFATSSSTLAQEVGAANTLVRQGAGWFADNTDVAGVVQALREGGCDGVDAAVVIGSGATARSVVAALAQLGVREVTFVVRSRARPETVALAKARGMNVQCVQEDERDRGRIAMLLASTPLLVSTTPAHAADTLAQSLHEAPALRQGPIAAQLVFDVVYADWPTSLASVAYERGARVVSGLDMLVHQAAVQFKLFTGFEAPISDMKAAGLAAVER